MRRHLFGVALFALGSLGGAPITQAQPYCAQYDNDTRDCGIPTMAMCQQSLRGMGGVCLPDTTSQLPPDLINPPRLFQPPPPYPPPPPPTNPMNPNWLPPPPGQ
jgi:hypothetical protein